MKLIYINELGPNYKGDNLYEFIFTDQDDVWGEGWDESPAMSKPQPPELKFIKKVKILKNSGLELNLIQNSDFFSFYDAIDGVIALGWENEDSHFVINKNYRRLVFNFGDTIKSVENKIYERDIILLDDKILIENEY